MAQEKVPFRQHSNAYNIFILVLTVLSLGIMVAMFLPLSDETISLLQVYDNLICVIFLIDFYHNLRAAPTKSEYFIKERGWLDRLGSIPSFGLAFRYKGLFRLARLSRFARITRLLRGKNKAAMVKDILENRSKYTVFITFLMRLLVLTIASVFVLLLHALISKLVSKAAKLIANPSELAVIGGALVGMISFALPLTATAGSDQLGTGLLAAMLVF